MTKTEKKSHEDFVREQEAKYPELKRIARGIAMETCKDINAQTKNVVSEMPYKAQFVLEEVIKILEAAV